MNGRKLSIADVTAPQIADSGDFVYRVTQPGRAISAIDGIQSISFTMACSVRERIFREADVLIIHMVGDPDLLPVIIERKRRGQVTVFEVSDNFMDFQLANPAAAFYEDPSNRACLMQLLSLCDAMQTTMPELEKRFLKYNPVSRVFMNQMKDLGDPSRSGKTLTLGWGGSLGHYDDMKRAAPYLIGWLNRRPDVNFSIMAEKSIAQLFDAVPAHRKTIVKPGSLQQYYDFVQTLDIGLAIVENEEFNLCRSDVKFMEYASRGVAPVCSASPTYSRTVRAGTTGFLFSTFEEMTAILDTLVEDRGTLRRVAQAAFNYIKNERQEGACAIKRLEFYAGLFDAKGTPPKGPLAWIEKTPGAEKSPGSNHYLMTFGRVEALIYSGLISQFRNNDFDAALRYFQEAASAAPSFYPARYYLANALASFSPERATRELEAAMKANPEAISAPLLMATLQAKMGNTASALKTIRKLQAGRPEFAPAFSIEGDIASNSRDDDLALSIYKRALEANPHFAPASIMAGAILLQKDDYEEAAVMFRRAIEVVPRSAGAQTGLAASLMRIGYPDEAEDRVKIAIESAPQYDDAAKMLIEICKTAYKESKFHRAIENLEWLCEKRPDDADALFWLARTLERAARFDDSIACWKRLIEIDVDNKYTEIARTKVDARG